MPKASRFHCKYIKYYNTNVLPNVTGTKLVIIFVVVFFVFVYMYSGAHVHMYVEARGKCRGLSSVISPPYF